MLAHGGGSLGPAELIGRWRDRLRATDPTPHRDRLSAEGIRAALDAALDALGDRELAAAIDRPGQPFATAAMAVARTVSTAPIEWCAVLLGRGTRVTLKTPRDRPGLAPLLVQAAEELGLPLTATDDRTVLTDPELLIAMGADESVARIGAASTASRKLLFGARFSVAWVVDPASMAPVAADAALHDGLGCLSPVVVASPLPLAEAVDALAAAMADQERILPRGSVDGYAAARIRDRRALARVVGRLAQGPGWEVHGLPADRVAPEALPRAPAVISVPSLEAWLEPWRAALSTVGTDDPELRLDGARVVPLGTMQRPPLARLHDGVDWLALTLR